MFATTSADESEIAPAAPRVSVPTETVVVPVYVLVAEMVSVPPPCFVRVPVVVAIAPEIVESPTPSIVKPNVLPVKPPDMVSVEPVSICTSVAAPSVIAPESVFEPDVLRIAPTSADETVTPSPEIVNGSAELMPPDTESVALLATVVP